MGNSAWGHGYHAGKAAGRAAGRTEGAALAAVASVVFLAGAFVVQKVHERRTLNIAASVEAADHDTDHDTGAAPQEVDASGPSEV